MKWRQRRHHKLKDFLEDVVLGARRPIWKKLFDRLGSYFDNTLTENDPPYEPSIGGVNLRGFACRIYKA